MFSEKKNTYREILISRTHGISLMYVLSLFFSDLLF